MADPNLDSFQQNPFLGDRDVFARARAVQSTTRARHVLEALEDSDIAKAERRLLAIGHAEATLEFDELLDMPDRVWRQLPHARDAYVRIVEGAGRCVRALSALVGDSPAMRRVRRSTWSACFGDSLRHAMLLEQVIMDHDVLVLGETGTGKEAIATAIQNGMPGESSGKLAPRSALNAAAVPDTLIESELFGHVKGAFTGANEARLGRIRNAKGGCFFLDEVGDLRETTQVKLLRVMETNEVSPLGADHGVSADCRYVAATHKDLEAMVEDGRFRRDLYQRLAGHVIRLPPLRERREDIPALGAAFVARYVPHDLVEVWSGVESWLDDAASWSYDWPGNVRELQNALRSVMLGLSPDIRGGAPVVPLDTRVVPASFMDGTATMREVGDWYLSRVLEQTENNYAAASRVLEMDRATVRRRAAKLPRE